MKNKLEKKVMDRWFKDYCKNYERSKIKEDEKKENILRVEENLPLTIPLCLLDKKTKAKILVNKIVVKEGQFVHNNRKEILKICGNRCMGCNKAVKKISFHHITYNNLPHQDLKQYCKFLIPLCNFCHKKIHG